MNIPATSDLAPLLAEIYGMTPSQRDKARNHLMLGGGTRGGPTIDRGKGVHLWDVDGKEYIDCTSQSWAMYLGHAHDEINAIIRQHAERMTHIHQGFDTSARLYLAEKLASLAPQGLNRVSFTVGGGPAIEAAMKICARDAHQARDFVTLYDSYHGTTLGTMGASWISTRSSGSYVGGASYLALTRAFVRIPNPDTYRNPYGVDAETYCDMCLTMARATFRRGIAGRPAGVIVEPIQASAGQLILPRRYLQGLRTLCDEYETPLVFDEIQTFARIGQMFAADYFGVTPDIIVLGKGLGAGLPLAAIIVSDRFTGFSPHAEELHTFAQPTLSMVACAKMIDLLEAGLLENCRKMGAYLGQQLRNMQKEWPCIGDVRQAGLHIGIELVLDPMSKTPMNEEAEKIRLAGFRNGLFLGMGGVRKNVLKIKPPLIVTRAECDEILGRFERSLRDVIKC